MEIPFTVAPIDQQTVKIRTVGPSGEDDFLKFSNEWRSAVNVVQESANLGV